MNDARTFAFGPFQLIPERQLLLRDDSPVRIGGRALDLLTALVERAGELVMKHELIARVWPTTTVDEANLKVNMAALRRVLDDDPDAARYIATVSGRGYRFIASLRAGAAPPALPRPEQPPRFRFVDLQPDSPYGVDANMRMNALPGSIDTGIVIDGEITLVLDDAIVMLKPGSVVIHRGTGRQLLVQLDDRHKTATIAANAQQ